MGADEIKTIVLSIGEEVLRGEVVNTNAAWLGAELSGMGFRVSAHRAVQDELESIAAAFREAAGTAGFVVVTGGLGPTGDDLTAAAAARFLGTGMIEVPWVLDGIAARAGCGLDALTPERRRQALVPETAEALPNPCGTAPGICFAVGEGARRTEFVLLPGVPAEMRAIFDGSVRERIERLFPVRARRLARYWHLAGRPEAEADAEARRALVGLPGAERLELGTVLGRGWVTVRVQACGDRAERLLDEAGRRLDAALGECVWGHGRDETLEGAAAAALVRRGLTLALAESCTGGLVACRLVAVPGVSAALLEALVTYSDAAKTRLLGVPPELIAAHGAVSRECAEAMATGLRERCAADITLAVTGIAGPGGGSADKPAGTVHFALASADGVTHQAQRFGGSREWVRERAASHALWMIRTAAAGRG